MKEFSFEISHKDAGERLDKWLTAALSMPRAQVKHLLDNGKVLINNRRVLIAGWELEQNDHIIVRVPDSAHFEQESSESQPPAAPVRPHSTSQAVKGAPRLERERKSAFRNIGKPTLLYEKEQALAAESRRAHEKREHERRGGGRQHAEGAHKLVSGRDERGFLKVYYQDKHLIVVEKSAGLLTLPQKGSDAPSLVGMVQRYLRKKFPHSKHSFLMPLHRLDAETSGILVFALSREGEKLAGQFKSHTIQRRYLAVVHGAVEKNEGVIEERLEKGRFRGGRKVRIAHGEGGKEARTAFSVKERYAKTTLVEARVLTGRTHQIRVHFASKGHPLIGDKLYSDKVDSKIDFPRHALHATYLAFRHPVGGKALSFTSPLPEDMKNLVDKLRGG